MPELDREELAQQYGWALSVLRSSSELWGLFRKAVKGQWETPKFVAELRDTNWFKRHSEAWRQNQILKRADPGEWHARREQLHAQLRDTASEMGALLSTSQLSKVMDNVMNFGWSETEIRNTLASYVRFSGGRLFGQAAITGDQLRQTSLANGYRLSDANLQSWARRIAGGDKQLSDYQDFIREQAARSYKVFADELRAGADLADLASPWVESMARTWEMNPNEITMFDPTLRKALSTIDPETGQAMSLSDFETRLRGHLRFRGTKLAQDSSMSKTRNVLAMLGISI